MLIGYENNPQPREPQSPRDPYEYADDEYFSSPEPLPVNADDELRMLAADPCMCVCGCDCDAGVGSSYCKNCDPDGPWRPL